jgi:class 3 adenylate cyclase
MSIEEPMGVLYVDDEEHNLVAFRAAFRRRFRVHTSTSGRQAIGILRENDIPIVITDQRMPDMMGVQFLEAITPEFPDTVRMILTGFSDVGAVIKAINTGRVYRYITKPWDEQELLMTLNGAADVVRLQRRERQLMEELQERLAQQERVVRLFQKYVPEHVVQDMIREQGDDASLLDGESRIVSVLMADIRNFTALSSRLDPQAVVRFLNAYFSTMAEAIRHHQGTVNKYLGDGILGVFGAPISSLDNPVNAVLCAIEMRERLAAFNEEWAEKLGGPIHIGIGINTGEVVVGNIGSEERVEYTVIGDTVNVASRIEGLTHGFPEGILVGATTAEVVRPLVELRPHEPVLVKGKDEPLSLWWVVDRL